MRYALPLNESEDDMTTTRLLRHAGIFAAAALIAIAVGGKPAAAVGSDNPPPSTGSDKPKEDKKKSEKQKKKQNSLRELQQDKAAYAKFLEGYRAARDMILDGKYEQGIAAMHALGYDNHPDVANYVGYSYRRLGDYDQSRHWYEAALAADPKHARTWSYYGMWQAEQGNRLKAEDFLQKVKLICGNESCKEFTELRAVIDGKASY
jgi:tetratricopeptide (TPR) repeat protein